MSRYCHNFEVVKMMVPLELNFLNWWYLYYLSRFVSQLAITCWCLLQANWTLNTRLNQNIAICQSSPIPHQLSKWPTPGCTTVPFPIHFLSVYSHPYYACLLSSPFLFLLSVIILFPPCSFRFFPLASSINNNLSFSSITGITKELGVHAHTYTHSLLGSSR